MEKLTIRNIVLTATILALSMILVFMQLPLLGMGIDLSLVAVIIGRRFIGLPLTIIVCMIYPWVSVGFMGPIGALFVVMQSIGIVLIDWYFNKEDFTLMGVIYTILLGTAYSLLINFVIIVPMYWGLANNTYGNFFGDYSDMSSSFLKYEFSWFITGLVFNPIKLNIIFWMSMGLWKALVDSLNMENYIKDSNKVDDLE